MGREPLVDWENDKPTVVALREIAEGLVTRQKLEQEARRKAAEQAAAQAAAEAAESEAE
jgi:DNA-directed RNA polymerase subunit omega